MFSRIVSALTLSTLSILAAATTTVTVTPTPSPTPIPANQCNAGNLQCCSALERSDGSTVGALLASVGVVLEGVEALVGITCAPIDILGIGQNACHGEAVCCQDTDFNGLLAIGCVPISINL